MDKQLYKYIRNKNIKYNQLLQYNNDLIQFLSISHVKINYVMLKFD